jgi:hypothetical protein
LGFNLWVWEWWVKWLPTLEPLLLVGLQSWVENNSGESEGLSGKIPMSGGENPNLFTAKKCPFLMVQLPIIYRWESESHWIIIPFLCLKMKE